MVDVKPSVTLLASTQIDSDAIGRWMNVQPESTDAETLITFAGRSCYQSFDRPNPGTYRDSDYLRRTLFEQGHWSIAEHASATFYITGVSRAFTHELIRHRHLSFSQLSQRFVDEGEAEMVTPPAMSSMDDIDLDRIGQQLKGRYRRIVEALTSEGLPRKQAREAARAVLPNMTETRIVVTGNLRAWKEVIDRRTQSDADAEMQEVMGMVRDQLVEHVSPAIFGEAD